ncbi:hypothetical protein BURCENBC7_AP6286 [Burkholderia cenocepacia BC7]|nr:hypothetical protein BURCENK562V_C1938 [Burkholderia cenocepacia K56-2Valvano]ERI29879.1 hypothetical protein BURCENBC7_AP6286 [Burkholderia cenocepacia BC7]
MGEWQGVTHDGRSAIACKCKEPASDFVASMRFPEDAGGISAEVSVHGAVSRKRLPAKTLLNASGKWVPGRAQASIRPTSRPDRMLDACVERAGRRYRAPFLTATAMPATRA